MLFTPCLESKGYIVIAKQIIMTNWFKGHIIDFYIYFTCFLQKADNEML